MAASLRNGRLFGDESAYRFQARLYASGQIKAVPMPGATYNATEIPTEIFYEHTLQTPGGWFSKYPPGWPIVLAFGYLLHIPWLINPLLAVVQLICIWYLARPFGSVCQTLALTFVASSVYFLMWSVGYMSHACGAALALLALAAIFRSVRNNSLGWLSVAFALVFFETQVRPFTGAVIGVVYAGVALWGFRRQKRMAIAAAAIIGLAATASAAGFLFMNWLHTGDVFLSPYAMINGGRDVQEVTLHPLGILNNLRRVTRWETIDTTRSMFPFLFLLVIYAVIRERQRRFEIVSLALLLPALVAAHIIKTQPSGSFNGDRFYFEGFGALAIAGARGSQLLIEQWKLRRRAVLTVIGVMLAVQIVHFAFGMKEIEMVSRPYALMYELAHGQNVPLVFLHDGPRFIAKHTNWNDLQWWTARTIYLVDPGPDRRDQAACRFGRPVWSVLTFNPETNRGSALAGTSTCGPVAAAVH